MDTSEVYIKMCEKAVAAGLEWHVKMGQRVVSKIDKRWYLVFGASVKSLNITEVALANDSEGHHYGDFDYAYWIPLLSQCELQAMVIANMDTEHQPSGNELHFLTSWLCRFQRQHHREFASLSQYWLAFAMHQIHNKIWDGEDWQK